MVQTFNNLKSLIFSIGISDVIDILLVTFLIFGLLLRVRSSGALKIAATVAAVFVLTAVTGIARMRVINFLLSRVTEIGTIALIIVFQPELRRMLERTWTRLSGLFSRNRNQSLDEQRLAMVVSACEILSKERTGALLVFERNIPLDDYFKSGTVLDAEISSELIRNLFFTKAALHDGAVIIQNGRIAAAGCVLPLTADSNISSDLGTRHRAGKGMSEETDALVVIVSEETGSITVALDGMLKQYLSPETLRKILYREMIVEYAEDERERVDLKKLLSGILNLKDRPAAEEDKPRE